MTYLRFELVKPSTWNMWFNLMIIFDWKTAIDKLKSKNEFLNSTIFLMSLLNNKDVQIFNNSFNQVCTNINCASNGVKIILCCL